MSEKVMIDGIDVSGCRLRVYNSALCNGFKMDNSGFHQGHCIQNPNCYYKQLQRAKEENERLEQLYQDNHCEVLRLQKGLKYIEKYTHSPIADTVRMGIIRNTIKELLNDNK